MRVPLILHPHRPFSTLLLALLIGACSGETGQNADPSPKGPSIQPAAQWIRLGSEVQFSLLLDGQPVSPDDLTWTLSPAENPGGDEASPDAWGTIGVDGLYTAPSTIPQPNSILLKADAPSLDIQTSITFSLGDILNIAVEPENAGAQVGGSVKLTVKLSALPEDEESLKQVLWAVEDTPGGTPDTGTISQDGTFKAPGSIPSSNPVKVTATSIHFPDRFATAWVHIYQGEAAILPTVETVPVRTTMQFMAMHKGEETHDVDWAVDGVLGGDAKRGFIDESGRYTAPQTVNGAPASVKVQALEPGASAPMAETQFALVELVVSPNQVKGVLPGLATQLAASAHFSDGRKEDVSKLATTRLRTPNPAIAALGNGLEVVLGPDAGESWVAVEDDRYSPAQPATALVNVSNIPDFLMELEPNNINRIVMGSRHPFDIFLVADRGPDQGDRQSILFSPTIEITPLDANGLVAAASADIPKDPASLVAVVDQERGEVLMGGKYGTAQFRVFETETKKEAILEVNLVELSVSNMVTGCQFNHGVSGWETPPCAAFESPVVIPIPEWVTDPFFSLKIPRSIRVHTYIYDKSQRLTLEEITQQLEEVRTVWKDLSGNGAFLNRLYPCSEAQFIAGTCPQAGFGSQYLNAYNDWIAANGCNEQPQRGSLEEKLYHLNYGPPEARCVLNSIHYIPSLEGPNKIQMTLQGLSQLPSVPDPVFDLTITGRYPKLALLDYSGKPFDSAPAWPAIHTLRLAPINLAQDTGISGMEGFDFLLKGEGPDGTQIAPDDIVVLERDNSHRSFSVLFRKPGKYRFWVESNSYPLATLPDELSLDVDPEDPDNPDWHNAVVELPTLQEFYSDLGGLVKVTFTGPSGQTIPALPLPNTLCESERPEAPEKGQPHMEHFDGMGGNFQAAEDCTWVEYDGVRFTLVEGQAHFVDAWTDYCAWAPTPGSTFITFTSEVVDPPLITPYSDPLSTARRLLPNQGSIVFRTDACGRNPRYPIDNSSSLDNQFFLASPQLFLKPTVTAIPLPADAPVKITYTLGNGLAPIAAANANLPQPEDFTVTAHDQQDPVEGVTVDDVMLESNGTLSLTLAFAPPFVPGEIMGYDLHGEVSGVKFKAMFDVGRIHLRGDAPPTGNGIDMLALNARPSLSAPEGTMKLWVSASHNNPLLLGPVRVVLDIFWAGAPDTSEDEEDEFVLAGFSRYDLPKTPGKDGNESTHAKTVVRKHPATISLSEYYRGETPTAPYEKKVTVYGNITDEWLDLNGKPEPVGDMIPDRVSSYEGDIKIRWLDPWNHQNTTELASTTAYVLEARRTGGLVVGPKTLAPSELNTRAEAVKRAFWSSLSDAPLKACTPIKGMPGEEDPTRDIFVHLDTGTADDELRVGLMDMPYLTEDGIPFVKDGRAHDYLGESPVGKPDFESPSGNPGWRWFGIELDGVCFDPAYRKKKLPNSDELFQFAAKEGYKVPKASNGLVPGIGGTSGGIVRPEDGRFELLTRTPGVDFPGLDCGYLADEDPATIAKWGGNGIEEVSVKQPIVEGDLPDEFVPYPRRVFTFSESKDWKSRTTTGVQSRGYNASFIVTTRPTKFDGSPLISDRKLKATLVVGEYPVVTSDDEGFTLTARIDRTAEIHATAVQWAIPIIAAAITGAIGASIEGGAMLSSIGVNVLVAAAFVGVDKALDLGLGAMEGSVMATTTGKMTGKAITKTALRMLKCLKYFFRAGQGAAQTLARRAVNQAAFKSVSWKKTAMSMGQDALGGFIGSIVAQKISESILDNETVGGAEVFAFDQLWVTIPQEAVTSSSSPNASRTMAVSQVLLEKLSANDDPTERPGVSKVEADGASHAYNTLSGRATQPLLMTIVPGSSSGETSPPRCGDDSESIVSTADFRITVGGPNPTRIPYVRVTVAGVGRDNEEATARIKINRSNSSLNMLLLDAILE